MRGVQLLVVVATTAAESDSWEWGYDHAGDIAWLLEDGWSPESVYRRRGHQVGRPRLLDKPEATEGCLAGLRDMGRIE